MKVCVVTEWYPNPHDPGLAIWAHRQARAARQAGAEVRVIVLHRPIPPLALMRRPAGLPRWLRLERAVPRRTTIDGIDVRYLRFVSPPRPLSYQAWGGWAEPALRRELARLREEWPFELIHAHCAVPAGRAAAPFARARGVPLAVSVHDGDVLDTVHRSTGGRRTVARVLDQSELVLCNSAYTLERAARLGIGRDGLRVLRLGADPPDPPPVKRERTTLVSSGYLIPRKRHEDVLRALALLRPKLPQLSYAIVGDGPERERLRALAAELGLNGAVEFTGRLDPEEALRAVASCHLLVLPSLDEAFGVVYVEAMAAGLPAIGCAGEGGPEEIAPLGKGMVRVPARDPVALAAAIEELVADREALAALGERARITAREHFSWERCGAETVAAYRDAARRGGLGR